MGEGIEVLADTVSNVTVENNFLHGGEVYGIHLYSIGTGGSGNVVNDNTVTAQKAGIEVQGDGLKAAITQNTLYDNTGLGIDLDADGDGPDQVTHNDAGDTDTGPNSLLNYPVFTSVTPEELDGTACANCKIELFIADPDPTGYGEGELFLRQATADGDGNWTMSLCELELDAGTALTATATDPAGETSEFSLNFALQQPTSTTCTVPTRHASAHDIANSHADANAHAFAYAKVLLPVSTSRVTSPATITLTDSMPCSP